MGLELSYSGLVAFLLALVRSVAWLKVTPPFSDSKVIPSPVTMSIGAGLALLIGPTIPTSAIPTSTALLIGSVVVQVLTGVALGSVVNLLFSSIAAAGGLIDLTGGLNLPPSIDPLGNDQTPMLGQFYQQVALLLLLASGAYVMIIEGLVRSFQNPGFSLDSSNHVTLVLVADLSTFFTSAVEIAAPILIVLFATQIILAFLSKVAPQMNVWILGMPLQIFLALILVGLGLSVLPHYVANLVDRALSDGSTMFRAF